MKFDKEDIQELWEIAQELYDKRSFKEYDMIIKEIEDKML